MAGCTEMLIIVRILATLTDEADLVTVMTLVSISTLVLVGFCMIMMAIEGAI